MEYRNYKHVSRSDKREHWTVLLATDDQSAREKCEVVHVYANKEGQFDGFTIIGERETIGSDEPGSK
jgi:hypothetical protein